MNIYEMYGRQAEEAGQRIERLTQFYNLTMRLLRDLKDGRVALSQLVVASDGWEVEPEAETEEGEPGTGDEGEKGDGSREA